MSLWVQDIAGEEFRAMSEVVEGNEAVRRLRPVSCVCKDRDRDSPTSPPPCLAGNHILLGADFVNGISIGERVGRLAPKSVGGD